MSIVRACIRWFMNLLRRSRHRLSPRIIAVENKKIESAVRRTSDQLQISPVIQQAIANTQENVRRERRPQRLRIKVREFKRMDSGDRENDIPFWRSESQYTVIYNPTPGTSNENPRSGSLQSTRKVPRNVIIYSCPSQLDIRVGRILKVSKHRHSHPHYIYKINVGEPEHRTIVSKMANYYSLEDMHNRLVVVLCNIKEATRQGIEFQGMILCASTLKPKRVETLNPPESAKPGEQVIIENFALGASDTELKTQHVWNRLEPDMKTNSECKAQWLGNNLMTRSGGLIRSKSMKETPIKAF